MPFKLSPLPYGYEALEPHYDAATVKIHHDKHHQTYVDNLNKLLADHPDLNSRPLDDLLTHLDEVPASIRTKVANNAGGVWNHDFLWKCMGPAKNGTRGAKPLGKIAKAIDAAFGSFDAFQAKFKEAALAQFGSGWAWLLLADDGDLEIGTFSNQDCPVRKGRTGLLTIDVWEHAYYLKWQNRRAEWIDTWWNVVDWNAVEKRMGG